MDAATAKLVDAAMAEAFRDATVIAVAHRLPALLETCDRVAVMSEGRVVEEGRPRCGFPLSVALAAAAAAVAVAVVGVGGGVRLLIVSCRTGFLLNRHQLTLLVLCVHCNATGSRAKTCLGSRPR